MKVFLNPGHAPGGVPDPGAVNAALGLREADVVAAVGAAAAAYLRAAGCEVMVCQDDSLAQVTRQANAAAADLFVSIHCNSAGDQAARGTEVWYCDASAAGRELANCIQNQLVAALGLTDRGCKAAVPGVNGLYVLTRTAMPAVLAELAFLSNPEEAILLASAEKQKECAAALARGVTDYAARL
ncbi:N-acetylmuramoyl-L-alanine amidase [Azotosporobacter soli]|uniref:N-acetylmuramoyl-L-alanine amidase family protein n=1 Tax=Azotosporobacter soli TaxID=3055040 RepID=UPI0031FEEC2D